MLDADVRAEFLACPQLVRAEQLRGQDGYEPVLLIKGSTLLLKYVVLGAALSLKITRVADRLVYGVEVADDPEHPAFVWSVIEGERERDSLRTMAQRGSCRVFLFNELAMNVAWADASISISAPALDRCLHGITVEPIALDLIEPELSRRLDARSGLAGNSPDGFVVDLSPVIEWTPLRNTLITSRAASSVLNLFDDDEGRQQERLALWLTDNLLPSGAHASPSVPKGKGSKELTDVLLTYQHGAFLIESKVLSILSRKSLPNRAALASDTARAVQKAVRQLRGAIRTLKSGVTVSAKHGEPIEIERRDHSHAIILIPDLRLIENPEDVGMPFIRKFMEATGAFVHLLDPAELLRIVQAADMIATRGTTVTPMMALDYYLIERAKRTIEARTLRIEVLLRFADGHAEIQGHVGNSDSPNAPASTTAATIASASRITRAV
jgi:hypothetical protein